jgi:hypothetical protein
VNFPFLLSSVVLLAQANLITKLGAESRTHGGMFTTNVDIHPGSTLFEYDLKRARRPGTDVDASMTTVSCLALALKLRGAFLAGG